MNRVIITLMLAVASLLVFGGGMMVSLDEHIEATGQAQSLVATGQMRNQLVWIGIGLVLMWEVSRVDYRRWRQIATPFAGMVFMLLVMALIPGMGPTFRGARRWLYLGPWGAFQPSHLAGFALVLLMAWWYWDGKERPGYFFWIPLSVILFWSGLVFYGRDFTTALLLLLTGGVMMILGGERVHYLLLYIFWVASGLAWLILRNPLRISRIIAMSMEPPEPVSLPLYTLALASGGWSGVGLGKGHYVGCILPEAGSEFMAGFIGEELGMIGLLTVNVLYAVIAACGLYIGAKAPDRFGTLLAFGIASLTVMPVLLTLLSLTSLICIRFPLLPFVSGGGLHLFMSLIGVGVLLNIARTKGADHHEMNMPDDDGEARVPSAI